MMYKVVYKNVCVDQDCLKLSRCINARGNMFKIAKESVKLDVKISFFALRTVDMWIVLSNDIVRCKKSHLFAKNLQNINFTTFLKEQVI